MSTDVPDDVQERLSTINDRIEQALTAERGKSLPGNLVVVERQTLLDVTNLLKEAWLANLVREHRGAK